MPTDGPSITIQFLSKLDTIQKDMNKQGMRLERLNTIQEVQTAQVTDLSNKLDKLSDELPQLRDVERLQVQVSGHDRQLNEQTGRWQAFDHRKAPGQGIPRSTMPPSSKKPSIKDLKDWGTIFRMIALAAVISAGVTAALATAGQMGWLTGAPIVQTPQTQVDKTKELMNQIQQLQTLFNKLDTPAVEASLPDTTEAVYE